MKPMILGAALSALTLATPALSDEQLHAKTLGIATLSTAQTLVASVEQILDHSCQITLSEEASAVTALQGDIATFNDTLHLLRTGGEAEGITPIRSPRALRALDLLEERTTNYLAFAAYGARGTMEMPYLDHLYQAHAPIPDASQQVVDVLNTTFMLQRVGMLESSTLGTLNDMAQQHTLISANLCLIAVGSHSEAARNMLNTALNTAQHDFDLLTTGDAMNKILPPTAELRAALDCVRADLAEVQSLAAPYVQGDARPTLDQYAQINATLGAMGANAQQSVAVFEAAILGASLTIPGCATPAQRAS